MSCEHHFAKRGSNAACAAIAAFAAFACASSAQAAVTDTFENDIAGAAAANWSGNGLVAAGAPVAPANGYGVTGVDHTKILQVEGVADRAAAFAGSAGTVDLLFKVSVPDEGDDPAPGDNTGHLAIAVNTSGQIVAFTDSTSPATVLDTTAYADGTWVRLTLQFDYTNHKCRVAINGTPCSTLLSISQSAALAGMSITGDTAVDDVVVKDDTAFPGEYDKYAAVSASGESSVYSVTLASGTVSVPKNYLTVNGKTDSQASANAYADKYFAGVAPDDAFAIVGGEVSDQTVTLTFPGFWSADSYVIKYGATAACENTSDVVPSKDGTLNTATLTLPESFAAGQVLYYKVARVKN